MRLSSLRNWKRKNLPVIICSNHSIADSYTKANFVSVQALQCRFEEIDLINMIDLDNVIFDTSPERSTVATSEKDEEEEVEEIIVEDDLDD